MLERARVQMWSVPNPYSDSVTLSRSIFLSHRLWYCGYPTSFVLGTVCVIAVIVKRVIDMYPLLIVLLVALPFGTAIICGALTQWAGDIVSGWSSVAGKALGIYFFHKCMEVLAT
jgi:hypothetical protein